MRKKEKEENEVICGEKNENQCYRTEITEKQVKWYQERVKKERRELQKAKFNLTKLQNDKMKNKEIKKVQIKQKKEGKAAGDK